LDYIHHSWDLDLPIIKKLFGSLIGLCNRSSIPPAEEQARFSPRFLAHPLVIQLAQSAIPIFKLSRLFIRAIRALISKTCALKCPLPSSNR
jgi:hypothetical protein